MQPLLNPMYILVISMDLLAAHGNSAVNLKIVFLPLLVFEVIILIDNFRYIPAYPVNFLFIFPLII